MVQVMRAFSAAVSSARAYSAQRLPRRFYKEVRVVETGSDAWEICLDQRKLRTPAKAILRLPSKALALAIAQEWDAQREEIRMGKMHLHGLAVTAQDNPNGLSKADLVRELVEKLLPADTILYQASEDADPKIREREEGGWNKVLAWAKEVHNLHFEASHSIAPPLIPDESRDWLRRHLEAYEFPALHGYVFGAEALKSFLLMFGTVQHWLEVRAAVSLSLAEQEHCEGRWGRVEWAHDVERAELEARLAAAALFVHFHSPQHSLLSLPSSKAAL